MSRTAHQKLPVSSPVSGQDARNVIVIGAGIIGLCSALWLLRQGHRVTIVDPAPPREGGSYEQACSFGNACTIAHHACLPVAMPGIGLKVPGMLLDPEGPLTIRWQHLWRMAPWIFQFLRSSTASEVERITSVLSGLLSYADDAYAPLFADANAAHLLRHDGCLYLYKNEKEFRATRVEAALREKHHVHMEVLGRDQIRQLEPNLLPLYERGVLFKDSYTVDSPRDLAFALADAVWRFGGSLIQGEAEQLLSCDDNVKTVVNGTALPADYVVVAGGAWSRKFIKSMQENVPLDTERGYHVFFPKPERHISRPVCYAQHGFYLTPVNGGIRAAGTVEFGSFERRINAVRTKKIASVAHSLIQGLGDPTSEWLGFRPSMPDSLPVIGPSGKDKRILYAFGHGHIGMTLGGITGRIIADLVSGRKPALDISPLRANRFN